VGSIRNWNKAIYWSFIARARIDLWKIPFPNKFESRKLIFERRETVWENSKGDSLRPEPSRGTKSKSWLNFHFRWTREVKCLLFWNSKPQGENVRAPFRLGSWSFDTQKISKSKYSLVDPCCRAIMVRKNLLVERSIWVELEANQIKVLKTYCIAWFK